MAVEIVNSECDEGRQSREQDLIKPTEPGREADGSQYGDQDWHEAAKGRSHRTDDART